MVFALGCGGSSAVRPRGPTWIASIELEGNSALDDDDVVPRLALDERAAAAAPSIPTS